VDWETILNSIPVDSYVELRKEDGTYVNPITVLMAIRRLEKMGIIKQDVFKRRTKKLPDGNEATLVFHYSKPMKR
jgi:hypothetical protein